MKKYYIILTALIFLVLHIKADAQLISDNVFLNNSFIEIGMAPNGSFGSEALAPAGFHPRGFAGRVGFNHDPHKDGWTVATPNYFGDCFLTGGVPHEGFEMIINGELSRSWRDESSTFILGPMNSISTNYVEITGISESAIWQGIIDSILITQTVELGANDAFIIVNVQFINTGSLPRNNVYYSRSVDIEAEYLVGSNQSLYTLVHQKDGPTGSVDNKVLVTIMDTIFPLSPR